MRIREKDAKKRQQAGGQEGTYRRKPTPVKRYAGDLLAPVSVTNTACAVDTDAIKFLSSWLHYICAPCLSLPVLFFSELPAKSAGQTDGHRHFP